jgi:mRNA-degrading endonuclease RelE of RelBE toxin-antitoxin system
LSYQIILAQEAETHLEFLTIRDQRIAIAAIEEQLPYQPNIATKNRQPMRPNPIATWKLRVGNLRVYYDIEEEPQVVRILAIGVKERNQVRIGDRYLEL